VMNSPKILNFDLKTAELEGMPMTAAEIAHLHRRAGFGATPAQLAAMAGLTRAQVVNALLDSAIPEPTYPVLSAADSDYQQLVIIRRWWLQHMVELQNPIREKLTLFWHNLIPTSYWKVPVPPLLLAQNQKLRNNAFGNISVLMKSIALDPAMLWYLDNSLNKASSPNENFARELMELFTLGADNGYTQQDVVESARAWSGHTLDGAKNYVFNAADHDSSTKTVFGIARNWDGPELIDEILTGSRAAISSEYLARRFWNWYAGPTTDATLVASLAAELRRAGLNTKEFLRSMFMRDEFYADMYRNTLVRSPIEWGVCLLRATSLTAQGTQIDWALADLGQSPFEPPSVSGWKQNEYWITQAAIWKKATMAGVIGWSSEATPFLTAITSQPPAQAVQSALDAFATPSVSQATRQALEGVLAANRDPGIGGGGQRANLIRAIALTPEFQLA
jgi:uncharacterized protein (DUF1800 family)